MNSFEHYLYDVIPRGSVVGVLFPKSILVDVLPRVAKEKNAKVFCLGSVEAQKKFAREGVLVDRSDGVDVFLTEPAGVCSDGMWVLPSEARLLSQNEVIAVVPLSAVRSDVPAEFDLVPARKVLTEKGLCAPDCLDELI
ncbi:hypothetical protein HY489_03915 [Candidatus Woesearchaeota archaeon]|nr:hypothetical protein [Candidatus Woesearchaeota archaeon]